MSLNGKCFSSMFRYIRRSCPYFVKINVYWNWHNCSSFKKTRYLSIGPKKYCCCVFWSLLQHFIIDFFTGMFFGIRKTPKLELFSLKEDGVCSNCVWNCLRRKNKDLEVFRNVVKKWIWDLVFCYFYFFSLIDNEIVDSKRS